LLVILASGCDPSGGANRERQEIVANLAFRPFQEKTSFRAHLESSSVLPMMPSKRVQRRTGLYRPIDVMNTVRTTYFVELDTSRGGERTWRFDFESFENRTTTSALNEAGTTDLNLPDTTLFVQLGGEEGPMVRRKAEESATGSQEEFAVAMARDLQNLEEWSRFLAAKDFRQGTFVEVPEGLHPGMFGEKLFGPIESSNATVSLFRLGIEDGSEVAFFDVHARMNARPVEKGKTDYYDIESRGQIVARIVDGLIVSYDFKSKVTPRTSTGAMLPKGSGQWEVRFDVDAETLRVPGQ
jgi:hypothetical protein